jgi:hypothetical protein
MPVPVFLVFRLACCHVISPFLVLSFSNALDAIISPYACCGCVAIDIPLVTRTQVSSLLVGSVWNDASDLCRKSCFPGVLAA